MYRSVNCYDNVTLSSWGQGVSAGERVATSGNPPTVEEHLWLRAMAHLRQSQRWQSAIKLILILGGGLLAGSAQFDIAVSPTTKTAMGLTGAGMAFFGGALLLAIEKDYVDLMVEARQAVLQWRASEGMIVAKAEELAALRRANAAEIAALHESVIEEREQLISFNLMLRIWDKARLLPNATLDERLDYFLLRAVPRLVTTLKLGGDTHWTFSIFLKKRIGRRHLMVRGPSCWCERSVEGEDRRQWAKGKGWTGMAWRRNDSGDRDPYVIEIDAATPDARARYDVGAQDDPEDLARFRSVTSIPFSVPGVAKTFGVVTVTSSHAGIFGASAGSIPYRNFNAINDFVRLVASLAAIDATAR